jgi:glycosyltransferase involved in cell wall biosynthesis
MGGVCFATYEGFDGCVQSCRNAAAVLGGTWALIPPDGEPPAAALDAELLVLSSWHERYEPILAQRDRPVVPRWHSTVLQSELCHEPWKMARILDLLDQGAVPGVAVSDPELRSALGRDGVVFVPEVLAESDYQGVAPARLRGVHVSLFGAAHGRKNILVQSAAFDRARRAAGAPGWTLHLNGQAFEDRGYERWLEVARIPYVDHGWLDRAAYLSLVAAMDAGLCATLSESYCYVAADHVALGVPIVASPTIACLGDGPVRVRPDRVEDVADALSAALSSRSEIVAEQRRSLVAQARTNAGIARSALSAIEARARAGIKGPCQHKVER